MEKTSKYRVIHAWNTTGQACNLEGKRCSDEESEIFFESFNAAKEHCIQVLKKLPFIECHIYSPDDVHLEFLINKKVQGKRFESDRSLGKFSARLFEWLSDAPLLIDGTYRTEDHEEPILEFSSYQEALIFCKMLIKKHPHMECWIYGPDGKIMNRGGTEVKLHESGNYTIRHGWR